MGARSPLRTGRRSDGIAVLVLLITCAYVWFVLTPPGQRGDGVGFPTPPWPARLVSALAWVRGDLVAVSAVVVVVAVGTALARKLPRAAVRTLVLVAVCVAVSGLLKLVLPRPDFGVVGYAWNTFPSGHMAFAVSSTVGLCGVVPERWRGWVATAGCAFAALSGFVQLVSIAHRFSDVVGAALLVAVVDLLLPQRDRAWSEVGRIGRRCVALVVGVIALLLVAPLLPVTPAGSAVVIAWTGVCVLLATAVPLAARPWAASQRAEGRTGLERRRAGSAP